MAEPMSQEELYADDGPPIAAEAEESIPTAEEVGEEIPDAEPEEAAPPEPKPNGGGDFELRRQQILKTQDLGALRDGLIRAERGIMHTKGVNDDLRREVAELKQILSPLQEALERNRTPPVEDDEPDPNDPVGRIERRFDKIERRMDAAGEEAKKGAKAAADLQGELRRNTQERDAFIAELADHQGTEPEKARELYTAVVDGWAAQTRSDFQRLYPRDSPEQAQARVMARIFEVTQIADANGISRAKALFLEALDDAQASGSPILPAPKPGNPRVRERVARTRQRQDETRDPLRGGGSAGKSMTVDDILRLPPGEYDKVVKAAGGYESLMVKMGKLRAR